MNVKLYTDGACSGNPGPGGYACYIRGSSTKLLIYGSKNKTTNNCMELNAVLVGIKHILASFKDVKQINVSVFTDSAYIVNAINEGWLYFWEKNEWNTKAGKCIKNKSLWQELLKLMRDKKLHISFIKVKGHSGNKYNELVDKHAKAAIKSLTEKTVKEGSCKCMHL